MLSTYHRYRDTITLPNVPSCIDHSYHWWCQSALTTSDTEKDTQLDLVHCLLSCAYQTHGQGRNNCNLIIERLIFFQNHLFLVCLWRCSNLLGFYQPFVAYLPAWLPSSHPVLREPWEQPVWNTKLGIYGKSGAFQRSPAISMVCSVTSVECKAF